MLPQFFFQENQLFLDCLLLLFLDHRCVCLGITTLLVLSVHLYSRYKHIMKSPAPTGKLWIGVASRKY